MRKPLEQLTVETHVDVVRPVHCAAPQIQQILVNLLENAAHAAGAGGWIRIDARELDGHAVIDVSDSGPGVKPELRERIFDPFFTTKLPGQGTGLGLSTSRRIAQQHRGTLGVVERAGRCVFRLELPFHT
jgi:signal transduction histidine kinase